MSLIITSLIEYYKRDTDDNKIPIPLNNDNQILTNIKKYTPNFNKLVLIANDKTAFEDNDLRKALYTECFAKSNITFKEIILLDERNQREFKQILTGADLIILNGGKCTTLNDFLNELNFKNYLKTFKGLCIGISAGAMNLCNTIYNFPEELIDINQPRIIQGLGYFNKIIIPHFDGENCKYQFDLEEVDAVNDYILPYSYKNELIGIPNGSYILIDNEFNTYSFGNIYSICNGITKKTILQ